MNFNNPYLIAETAFHHEGDIEFLGRLIDRIKKSKANAIKFHFLMDVDSYMIKTHPANEKLKEIAIDKSEWIKILSDLENSPLEVIALCNDVESVLFCTENSDKIQAIELHATGINDLDLLEAALKFNGYIFLGVGGCSIEEIQYAIDILLKEKSLDQIILMHGFQNYPTDVKDIDLARLQILKSMFKTHVGYADHTAPQDPLNETISALPQSMGFKILEKHVTFEPGKDRIDAQAAISFDQFERVSELCSMFSKARGDGYRMSEAELKYGDTGPMKKAIVAKEYIKAGSAIHREQVTFKRTTRSSYIKQRDINLIVGAEAKEDIEPDEILDFSNVNYTFSPLQTEQFKLKNK